VLSSEARTAQMCSWLGIAVTLAVAAAACGTRAGGRALASRLADRYCSYNDSNTSYDIHFVMHISHR
jgi:hypothetical protein